MRSPFVFVRFNKNSICSKNADRICLPDREGMAQVRFVVVICSPHQPKITHSIVHCSLFIGFFVFATQMTESFGHKFEQRHGVAEYFDDVEQISPIFLEVTGIFRRAIILSFICFVLPTTVYMCVVRTNAVETNNQFSLFPPFDSNYRRS
jgi:hypothetical protein